MIADRPMLEPHPVLREFPTISNAQLGELIADIRENGQSKAIALYEGKIWDGRARALACDALGFQPRYRFLNGQDPVIYLLERHDRRYGTPRSSDRSAALDVLGEIRNNERRAEAKKLKSAWLTSARNEFRSLEVMPKPCEVCGKYIQFTHAHHSLPLSLQFELGLREPIHDHDWLCPVHHRYVHILFGVWVMCTRDGSFLDGVPDHKVDEWKAVERVFSRGYELFQQVGGTPYNGTTWGFFQP